MIDVAKGFYPDGQFFTMPWDFWVIDNFLSSDCLHIIKQIMDTTKYTLLDSSDGHISTNVNCIANKYDIKLNTPQHKTIFDLLTNNTNNALAKLINKDSFINLYHSYDLIKCEPKYCYQKHFDHQAKLFSIVVYLEPDHGNGTVLLDKINNQYNVIWKCNRALIFKFNKNAFHYYKNTTNTDRHTLNGYLTSGRFDFTVTLHGADHI